VVLFAHLQSSFERALQTSGLACKISLDKNCSFATLFEQSLQTSGFAFYLFARLQASSFEHALQMSGSTFYPQLGVVLSNAIIHFVFLLCFFNNDVTFKIIIGHVIDHY
jgi:hypothetical protein